MEILIVAAAHVGKRSSTIHPPTFIIIDSRLVFSNRSKSRPLFSMNNSDYANIKEPGCFFRLLKGKGGRVILIRRGLFKTTALDSKQNDFHLTFVLFFVLNLIESNGDTF